MRRINWCICWVIFILLIFIDLSLAGNRESNSKASLSIYNMPFDNSLSKREYQQDKKRQSYNKYISKGDSLLKLKYYQLLYYVQ